MLQARITTLRLLLRFLQCTDDLLGTRKHAICFAQLNARRHCGGSALRPSSMQATAVLQKAAQLNVRDGIPSLALRTRHVFMHYIALTVRPQLLCDIERPPSCIPRYSSISARHAKCGDHRPFVCVRRNSSRIPGEHGFLSSDSDATHHLRGRYMVP